jgi:ankyrin repeat protein
MTNDLRTALGAGDPDTVRALVEAGADIHFQAEYGYDALLDAVHNRDILNDTRLIALLTLLIGYGVSLTGKSSYGESAVRQLSLRGRLDAVALLLQAGANAEELEMTELLEAVAFGTLADVEAKVAQGADLEARDTWHRTPWLLAIQIGDIAKARFLLEHGAQRDATDSSGAPPLFYAIEGHQTLMLEWLLSLGMDVHGTNKFGHGVLRAAAEYDNVEAAKILLRAGADPNHASETGTALNSAGSRDMALLLLNAGADPQELSHEGRRAILGYSPEGNEDLHQVSPEEFRQWRTRRFGAQNPEVMNNPFWEGMIRAGMNAYRAGIQMERDCDSPAHYEPIWCAQRFGQSLTFLPDGRIVQIAGEHEDSYDPDFCIYNDVFVHSADSSVTIYGYPEAIFPPTDFHTATLIGEYLYVIGSGGYRDKLQFSETPVYRLNTHDFHMERLQTTGDAPGWIYEHRADFVSPAQIRITDGKVTVLQDGREEHIANTAAFTLDVESLVWTRSYSTS